MFKLVKYLKPFAFAILLSVVLLYVQARCELKLPDYMSNIVDGGIQQSGIEDAVPAALRKTQLEKLLFFMPGEVQQSALNAYTLVDKSAGPAYKDYTNEYPLIEKEPLYILKHISKSERDQLNLPFAKAFLALNGAEQMQKQGGTKGNASQGTVTPDAIQKEMEKKFSLLGDKMIIQGSIEMLKAEYKVIGVDTDKMRQDYIFNAGLLMLLVSLLSAGCTIIVALIASKVAAGFCRDLRNRLFRKIEGFSSAEFDKFSTASLITRTTNDITQIQMLVILVIRLVFYAPILGIGGVVSALRRSASMSWTIALSVFVLMGFIIFMFMIAIPRFKAIQRLVDRLNLVTRENLSGMLVIRAFNTQRFEEERFDSANQDVTKNNLFVNRIMALMMPVIMFIMNGTMLLVIWVGAHRIENATIQVGDMAAFMQYAMMIIMSFLLLSMVFIMIPRASVSAERVAEVLATKPSILDPENPKELPKDIKGVVEFKNVHFKYPGAEEDVLKNISFTALPSQTTAFIGSTGSGKSTLVNLIPRFYDVTGGEILIDGINIKEISMHELREKIGYVPQKGVLFSGTIKSNIKYADENMTDEASKKAAEIAQASEFIEEKDEKFDAEISQGGSNVSGGQKQRLSIARAIAKNARIHIFDDSFSALDFKTDKMLRNALKSELENSTTFIVAQRISTIKNADQIIVLNDGEIVGTGKHHELLENCETYKEIAYSQLSKEELA